jgi:hypothetical protein
MIRFASRARASALIAAAALGLGACASLNPFGGGEVMPAPVAAIEGDASVPVSGWLWQAALDTLAFMPLQSPDPRTGVIVTGWMQPSPELPNERVRAQVNFYGRDLTAEGVRVTLFRQVNGVDAAPAPGAALQVEYAILHRARQLKTQFDSD